MANELDVKRLSIRQDQILEIQFAPWPDPPPAMLKLPGVAQWWNEMKLARQRDIQTMNRLVNNLSVVNRPS